MSKHVLEKLIKDKPDITVEFVHRKKKQNKNVTRKVLMFSLYDPCDGNFSKKVLDLKGEKQKGKVRVYRQYKRRREFCKAF